MSRMIDASALFYLAHKLSQAIIWPVTLVFVATRLSPVEQGVFFTILSFGAFQALAEFGLNSGLIHFLSQEIGAQNISRSTDGDDPSLAKLQALLRMSLRWTVLSGSAITSAVAVVGAYFFQMHQQRTGEVTWFYPWLIYCFAMLINILFSNMRSIAEGCGNLLVSQRAATVGLLTGGAVMIFCLIHDLRLYSLSLGLLANGIISLAMVMVGLRWQLHLALSSKIGASDFSWRTEFWPHQWRLAFSWLCGVAMFQSFVPAIYHHRGPIEAGQAGTALAIYNLLNSICMVWIVRYQVKIGAAWADRSMLRVHDVWRRLTRYSVLTAVAAALATLALLIIIETYFPGVGARLGHVGMVLPLLFACVLIQVSNVDTTIVRFGKKEIFNSIAFVSAVVISLSNWGLAQFGAIAVFASYSLFIGMVFVPWIRWASRAYMSRLA